MKKFVDLNFVVHPAGNSINQVVARYSESIHYLHYLIQWFDVTAVMHCDKGTDVIDGISYISVKATAGFNHTIERVKLLMPDFVLVQGLVFPQQVISLKKSLPPYTKILVQHHGGIPFRNPLKRYWQRKADKYTDAYLFTAVDNATVWINKGIINSRSKCYEVLEASTHMHPLDRNQPNDMLETDAAKSFLWVGRLDANKDPLTVLRAFELYFKNGGDGRLYMIYQTNDLLAAVKRFVDENTVLKENVQLVGRVMHEELAHWYSVADYYISGSHYEGSGYALIESMACGCTPIVTAIPSFKTIGKQCNHVQFYAPGDTMGLYNILKVLPGKVPPENRNEIVNYFTQHLSFKAIADNIYKVCKSL